MGGRPSTNGWKVKNKCKLSLVYLLLYVEGKTLPQVFEHTL